MHLADFDNSITYIHSKDACLTACAIVYICNAPMPPAMGLLHIAIDQSLLDAIITGYKTDDVTMHSAITTVSR